MSSLEDMFKDKLIPEQEMLNNLAYWYPILSDIRMRIPKTIIVHRGDCQLGQFLDAVEPEGYKKFEARIMDAMETIGFPCFLRTGMTSDKHSWKDTCYVRNKESACIKSRVVRLVEYSYMANIAGRPINHDFWCVREMIPTNPVVTYFNDMPIAMEVRAFINNKQIQCIHPYWPSEAFENAPDDVRQKARGLLDIPRAYAAGEILEDGSLKEGVPKQSEQDNELLGMLQYISEFFSGYWSVDMLKDKDGNWWCTDMAIGERSYHYPSCEHAKRE